MIATDIPRYELSLIEPMKKELLDVGFAELAGPDDVDRLFAEEISSGLCMVVINSVCGCGARNARPGIGLALQNEQIPDRLYTALAGVDNAAVERIRHYLGGMPASSPSLALFHKGNLVEFLHRADFLDRSPDEIAALLRAHFNELATRRGPSVAPAVYHTMRFGAGCMSSKQA